MIGVDAPPVEDGDEALRLMLHHLALAGAYFEATPLLIDRQRVRDALGSFACEPAFAWIEAMSGLYPDE